MLEDLVDAGKIRSIGVSNFNSQQIQQIIDEGRIKPANLQVRNEIRSHCIQYGVTG